MSPEQANNLARLIREKRVEQHLSASGLARQAGIAVGTVTRIELAQIPQPNPDSLVAIAEALGVAKADIFAAAGWMPEGELPTLRPYLRTKYHDLTDEDTAEIERYIARLQHKHMNHGPVDDEDEG